MKKNKGFTLIELMIVVAIIGILAAVALPKFADMVQKSRDAKTLGNLGAIRSAISIYYADQEGNLPLNLQALINGKKYLNEMPYASVRHHDKSNDVEYGP